MARESSLTVLVKFWLRGGDDNARLYVTSGLQEETTLVRCLTVAGDGVRRLEGDTGIVFPEVLAES